MRSSSARRVGWHGSSSRSACPFTCTGHDYEIDALAPDRVIHGVESNIVFGNNYVPQQFVPHVLDATDTALHQVMAGYWTRFMAAGIPNTDDPAVVRWPAFKHPTGRGRGSDKYLVFNVTVSEGKRLRESQCDLLEPLFLRTVLGEVPASTP